MNQNPIPVCLSAAVIAWTFVDTCPAENISFNFTQITYMYKKCCDDEKDRIVFGGGSSIPAPPTDFFGPGSLPFEGVVTLQGQPGLDALVMRRSDGAMFPTPPAPVDIPIELVALNLVSVQPITVTYSGGATEQWDLKVNLNPLETSDGVLRVEHNNIRGRDGGTIRPGESFFDVFAEITFSSPAPGGGVHHRFFSVVDRTQLTSVDAQWAHSHFEIAGGADREFIPGADSVNLVAPLQILLFEGGGLGLPIVVTAVAVPEPASFALVVLVATLLDVRRCCRK